MLIQAVAFFYDKNYIQKESDKKFINSTRIRCYRPHWLWPYFIRCFLPGNRIFKTGTGPTIHPISIGLTLSGL